MSLGHVTYAALGALVFAPAVALAEVGAGDDGERRGAAQPQQHDRAGMQQDRMRADRRGEASFERHQEGRFMADTLIGASVHSAEDDEIGTVSDVLIDREGKVIGIVVGVGGFLGVGERDVGLRWDALELTRDDDGDPIVRVDMDRATLERQEQIQFRDDDDAAGVWGQERRNGDADRQRARATGQAALLDQQHHDHFKADRLLGSTVQNAEGEEIGTISELLLDHDGNIAGVVVGVGGFLGVGEREVGLDWAALELTTDEDGDPIVRADVSRQALEQAQEFEYRDEDAAGGLWGQRQDRDRQPTEVVYREQPEARHVIARLEGRQFMADNLIGTTLRNPQGEELGQISDLLVDRDGRVLGVIVSVGGFLGFGQRDVGLAWDALELTADDDGEPLARADVERQTLRNAPRLERRD
jgi:ribosomal 30S subunit maturation factor RimM